MKKSIHVIISGRVQGVFYRANTKQKAEFLGLTGWVRNTKDRKVEAVFEGEEETINDMIKWCYKGSSLSKVEEVKIIEEKEVKNFDSFEVRY